MSSLQAQLQWVQAICEQERFNYSRELLFVTGYYKINSENEQIIMDIIPTIIAFSRAFDEWQIHSKLPSPATILGTFHDTVKSDASSGSTYGQFAIGTNIATKGVHQWELQIIEYQAPDDWLSETNQMIYGQYYGSCYLRIGLIQCGVDSLSDDRQFFRSQIFRFDCICWKPKTSQFYSQR